MHHNIMRESNVFALEFMELRIDEFPGFSTLGFRDMHVAPILSLRQQPAKCSILIVSA